MPWIFGVFMPCIACLIYTSDMADSQQRGREASKLRDTAGKQQEKELQALQKWGSLEPWTSTGKAWKSCHVRGPETARGRRWDISRYCYSEIILNLSELLLLHPWNKMLEQLSILTGAALLLWWITVGWVAETVQPGGHPGEAWKSSASIRRRAFWVKQQMHLTRPSNGCPNIRFWS